VDGSGGCGGGGGVGGGGGGSSVGGGVGGGCGGGWGAATAVRILDLGFVKASQLAKGELILCARAQTPEKEYVESTNLSLHVANRAPRSHGVRVSAFMADVSPSRSPTSSSGSCTEKDEPSFPAVSDDELASSKCDH
jgi:hypothetical protein